MWIEDVDARDKRGHDGGVAYLKLKPTGTPRNGTTNYFRFSVISTGGPLRMV
jgi:hypothetical protein